MEARDNKSNIALFEQILHVPQVSQQILLIVEILIGEPAAQILLGVKLPGAAVFHPLQQIA